jgi:hypothetical protein
MMPSVITRKPLVAGMAVDLNAVSHDLAVGLDHVYPLR